MEKNLNKLINACKLKTFVRINIASQVELTVKLSIEKHNEQVTKNRYILGRVIVLNIL